MYQRVYACVSVMCLCVSMCTTHAQHMMVATIVAHSD